MFGARGSSLRLSQRLRFPQTRSFCANDKSNSTSSNANSTNNSVNERYRLLQNLDMKTAVKLLTDAPKKKFGLDFHLVQLFFACLPSLAVYLVAQYARYDMKKMEVEVELKRKQRDEEEAKQKEKEMELNPPEKKEEKSDPRLLEVKERLDKLEETVKEIVVETKKQSSRNLPKSQVINSEKKQPNSFAAPSETNSSSVSNKAVDEDCLGKHNSPKPKLGLGEESQSSMATPNSSIQDPQGQKQGGAGPS